jgi:predicted DNA-binding transcriptional regulator AlpA
MMKTKVFVAPRKLWYLMSSMNGTNANKRPEKLLNLRQISRETGAEYNRLYTLAERGRLPKPTHLVGQRPAWSLSQLDAIKAAIAN